MAATEGVSILSQLRADVMAEKKKAAGPARQLTPVEGEITPLPMPLPKTAAAFPNDMPQEVVEEKARELDRIIIHLTEARDALLNLAGKPAASIAIDPAAAQKQKERDADAKFATAKATTEEPATEFAAEYAEKQEAAKAAVFAAPVVVEDGWTCPEHGLAGIEKVSAKSQRTYVGCPQCNLFKR